MSAAYADEKTEAFYAVLGLARGLLDARIMESALLGEVSDDLQAEARKIIKRGYEVVGSPERIKVAAERLREVAEVIRNTLYDDDPELGWSASLEEVATYLETGDHG